MPKHRRPSRLVRLAQVTHGPAQIGLAAGVAGTVAVTGTVVASAAPTTPAQRPQPRPGVAAPATPTAPDAISEQTALALRDAITSAQRDRAERLAQAAARAEAKRKKAERAQARRKAARREARLAAEQAEATQTFSADTSSDSGSSGGSSSSDSGSGGGTGSSGGGGGGDVAQMSASAASVLQIAAATASGAYYAYGGQGPNGFDCSGFTSYVFSKVGVSLPHSSGAQRGVVASVSNPRPGDLVFVYNGGGGSIGHVAIYAGGGYWWEASNPSMGVGKHRAWSSSVSYGRVL